MVHSRTRVFVACGLSFALCAASSGIAQERMWGHLEGTFRLKGEAPAAAPVVVTADKPFCGKFDLKDESLVVGRTGGIANVLVILQAAEGAAKPAVHPDVAKAATEPVVFNNAECRFQPRIAVVQVGQTLKIGNLDEVGHNVNASALFQNEQFNVTVPVGSTIEKVFKNPETGPRPVSCGIHPWMTGYLYIAATPYVAVTDDRGRFEIENLPVGKWTFRVYHERAGNVEKVEIGEKPVEWAKGLVEVEIKKGKNDLGRVHIPVAEF